MDLLVLVQQNILLRSNINNRLSRSCTQDLVTSAVLPYNCNPRVRGCTCFMQLNKIPSGGRSKNITHSAQTANTHLVLFVFTVKKIQISVQAVDSSVIGRNDTTLEESDEPLSSAWERLVPIGACVSNMEIDEKFHYNPLTPLIVSKCGRRLGGFPARHRTSFTLSRGETRQAHLDSRPAHRSQRQCPSLSSQGFRQAPRKQACLQ